MLEVEKQKRKSSFEQYAETLEQGTRHIKNLSDSVYRQSDHSGQGSVGSHFRHIVEFAFRLCAGVSIGKVDYNGRERDAAIEQNRAYAILQFNLAIKQLRNLPGNIENKQILLRLETSGAGGEESGWCISSVLREVEFLQSHSIHHYALIAEKLVSQGIAVEKDFGVSSSTLQFRKKELIQEKSMCIGK